MWQSYVVADWDIQDSMKKLLETLEISEQHDVVFPSVVTPVTKGLVSRSKKHVEFKEVQSEYAAQRSKRHIESNEVQREYAAQRTERGKRDTLIVESGDKDAQINNENGDIYKETVGGNMESGTGSKTGGNKQQTSTNNKNTHITLENTNIVQEGRDESDNKRSDNEASEQRRIINSDDKTTKEFIDTGPNSNKPDDVTFIAVKDWILEVKTNPILLVKDGLEAEWMTEGRRESVEIHDNCKLQTGTVRGDVHSVVALTTCEISPIDSSGIGDMTGLIQVNGDSYFIQPLVPTEGLNRQHPHLVYKTKANLALGEDQDFGDELKRSGSDLSRVTAGDGSRNGSFGVCTAAAECLKRSKRESYWRHNMREMNFSNSRGREEIPSTEERLDVYLVGDPDEKLEHTHRIIEDIRKKLEREGEVGYFLDNNIETEGKRQRAKQINIPHFSRVLVARFDVFTAVKIQVKVFCVVTPCSVVVGYQRFRDPYCLSLPFTLKMEAAWTSETPVAPFKNYGGISSFQRSMLPPSSK
jgi:hypothetical protein